MPIVNIDPELAKMLTYDVDPELELLGDEPNAASSGFVVDEVDHSLINAPVFTGDAFDASGPNCFPFRALYGRIIAQQATGFPAMVKSPKLYLNTTAPFSGIICGVQGSGKSHSTSVLLESCLIRDERLGNLPEPLSAVMFHFDTAAGRENVQPCEAAYIGSLGPRAGVNVAAPRITVLVLPTSLRTMRQLYSRLPAIKVEPLHFSSGEISGERLLAMMKVDQEQQMPLYMECIMSILRSMDDAPFDFAEFRRQLGEQKFSPTQKAMLSLRLNLLDSCLKGGNPSNRVSEHFSKGGLTIIDLSSPYMDGSSACGFFDIILGLFIEAKTVVGANKLVVLDEAHKYLTSSGSSSRLTDSLLSVIRQQRHLGMRVLISTQEPTVVPSKFLELCSFVIAHRFSSPKWLDHLKQHIFAVDAECFSKVVSLKTGEAIIFAPAGIGLRHVSPGLKVLPGVRNVEALASFGHGYLHVRSRARITLDGGRSLLAAPELSKPKPTVPISASLDVDAARAAPSISLATKLWAASTAQSTGSWDSKTPETMSDGSLPTNASRSQSMMLACDYAENSPRSPSSLRSRKTSMSIIHDSIIDPERVVPTSLPDSSPKLTISPSNFPGHVEPRFKPLVTLLQNKLARGEPRVSWTEVGVELKSSYPYPYSGKLGSYLEEAVAARLVEICYTPQQWVQLAPASSVPREYAPLVHVLRQFLDEGDSHPLCSAVADKLYKNYRHAFTGKFRPYAERAEAAGVVIWDPITDTIQLWVNVL